MEENAYQQADDLEDLFEDGGGLEVEENGTYSPAASTPAPPIEQNEELGKILGEGGVADPNFDLDALNNRPLDVGEKADDAMDFEDIELSDDDDDELPTGGPVLLPGLAEHALGEINFDQPGEDDDLFGDADGEAAESFPTVSQRPDLSGEVDDDDLALDLASDHGDAADSQVLEGMTAEDANMFLIQKALFEGKGLPETQEQNIQELIKLEFPSYREGETPYFNRLFPPRPGKYMNAVFPPKRKPIRPTKVSLEIEQDQKMMFNSTSTTSASEFRRDLVPSQLPRNLEGPEESSEESDFDEPLPGGVTMQDLEFLCADFDTLSAVAGSDAEIEDLHARVAEDDDVNMFGADDFDDFDDFEKARKKRRTGRSPLDIVTTVHPLDLPSFDDPERATAKLSQKVVLDLNDAQLLVEEIDPELIRAKMKPGEKVKGPNTIKSRLEQRFKTSNDAEYDLLKQNHQHKIRGQLSHLTIDHSTPALRLQYPYYKFAYDISQDLRNWKRKKMVFKFPISFSKLSKHKRKSFKGKDFKEVYASTKDLSLADNSTAILLEYSLEQPLMMSQVGMGNKIVNYYRRKTRDDTSRPKRDLGETSVLLPEDKSPFYMFGHIDPGEEVTALYNSMYRAPIFEQDMQPRDFLIVRETTGMGGQHHYMRNVDQLFVVGQELPSTTIPGTHSRMVTTAEKNRLKAIAYRIARRKKNHRIRVEDVTKHTIEQIDMQNRQKMKEFMVFNKEHKEWEMKNGEAIPDEEAVRELIRPEEVCLIEAMKVNQQYLKDAGYESDKDKAKDEEKDHDDSQDSIEQLLAPWQTSKTFIQATQGKAMIRVWGDGDPSGRDEAFSFIRTNMKGGYLARGAPIADLIAKENKPGTHRYNVAGQQESYVRDIRDTWENQKASLSSKVEPSDPDMDRDIDAMEDLRDRNSQRATPMSTPAPARQYDHETGTSFSKRSTASQATKFLKITRTVEEDGIDVQKTYVETDPAIIKAYMKAKAAAEPKKSSAPNYEPTGDPEEDARRKKSLEDNIAVLQAKTARRQKRQKSKAASKMSADGGGDAMSPDGGSTGAPTPSGRQQQATQRKCANCGQVGHIKTNKKLCPLLNGSIKQEDAFNSTAFMGAPPTLG